jgi:hypothetical protein
MVKVYEAGMIKVLYMEELKDPSFRNVVGSLRELPTPK